MKKQPIILVGGGGHCRSAIDVIEAENKYRIIGILDIREKIGEKILGHEIIGTDESLSRLMVKCKNYIVTVGQIKSARLRIDLYNKIKRAGGTLPNIISPNAYVSKYAKLGEGNIIMHQSTINANVYIKNNCIINNQALIEHDCKISSHVHISTKSTVNGDCIIDEGSFIGSGSTLIQGIKVAENVVMGAGCIVTKDIRRNCTVIGNPARVI